MYLLFDIGGTNMRIGISSDGKNLAVTKTVPTPKDFGQGINTIKQIANELSSGQKIEVIAGGVAGPLDHDKTMLVKSPHIGRWVGKPLKQKLAEVFGAEVYLENDTALVALGEATVGAGAGKNIVAYLTISTGVGGARIVNRKIDANSLGFEPGHQIIVPDGNLCNCGGKGHLEAYVGGGYVEKKYQQQPEEIKDLKIWDEITKYLAVGLTNTIVYWSPDIVVLGGSVMKSISLEKVTKHLKDVLTIFPTPPLITQSSLGNESGLIGSLQLLASSL